MGRFFIRPGRMVLLGACVMASMALVAPEKPQIDPAYSFKLENVSPTLLQSTTREGYHEIRRQLVGGSARVRAEIICQADMLREEGFKGKPEEDGIQSCADDLMGDAAFLKDQARYIGARCLINNTAPWRYTKEPSEYAVKSCLETGITGHRMAQYGAPAIVGMAMFLTLLGGQAAISRQRRRWQEKRESRKTPPETPPLNPPAAESKSEALETRQRKPRAKPNRRNRYHCDCGTGSGKKRGSKRRRNTPRQPRI